MAVAQEDDLVAAFRQQETNFKSFADEAQKLIDRLLRDAGIRKSQIEFRAKSPESLAEKLSRSNKAYSKLANIPDLAGIRVILYDLNDVRRAVEVIEREFDVDAESSGDAAEMFWFTRNWRISKPELVTDWGWGWSAGAVRIAGSATVDFSLWYQSRRRCASGEGAGGSA